jgi:hypothetical protein
VRAIRGDDVDSSGTSGEKISLSVDFQSVRDTFFCFGRSRGVEQNFAIGNAAIRGERDFPKIKLLSLQISWRWSNAIT